MPRKEVLSALNDTARLAAATQYGPAAEYSLSLFHLAQQVRQICHHAACPGSSRFTSPCVQEHCPGKVLELDPVLSQVSPRADCAAICSTTGGLELVHTSIAGTTQKAHRPSAAKLNDAGLRACAFSPAGSYFVALFARQAPYPAATVQIYDIQLRWWTPQRILLGILPAACRACMLHLTISPDETRAAAVWFRHDSLPGPAPVSVLVFALRDNEQDELVHLSLEPLIDVCWLARPSLALITIAGVAFLDSAPSRTAFHDILALPVTAVGGLAQTAALNPAGTLLAVAAIDKHPQQQPAGCGYPLIVTLLAVGDQPVSIIIRTECDLRLCASLAAAVRLDLGDDALAVTVERRGRCSGCITAVLSLSGEQMFLRGGLKTTAWKGRYLAALTLTELLVFDGGSGFILAGWHLDFNWPHWAWTDVSPYSLQWAPNGLALQISACTWHSRVVLPRDWLPPTQYPRLVWTRLQLG